MRTPKRHSELQLNLHPTETWSAVAIDRDAPVNAEANRWQQKNAKLSEQSSPKAGYSQ